MANKIELTDDEWAQAEFACSLAIAWWREGIHRRTGFARGEVDKYERLISKLSAVNNQQAGEG